MSELMLKAIEEMHKQPEPQQEALAAWILEKLASERKWTNEALAEHRTGKTLPPLVEMT